MKKKMKERNDTFQSFQNILKEIDAESKYNKKTELLKDYFEAFKGNLYIFCRLMLCKQDKRVYNLKDKAFGKFIAKFVGVPQDEFVQHMSKSGELAKSAKYV